MIIVQDRFPPFVTKTLMQSVWLAEYPNGTASVAVHVEPVLKPMIVVMNGDASDAGPDAGEGVPLVQVTEIVTVAALSGMKSL